MATVDLEAYREERRLTYQQLAEVIGAASARQARAWALGHERPSAETIDEICRKTGDRVSVFEMHKRRLDYERQRRQQRGLLGADEDTVAAE